MKSHSYVEREPISSHAVLDVTKSHLIKTAIPCRDVMLTMTIQEVQAAVHKLGVYFIIEHNNTDFDERTFPTIPALFTTILERLDVSDRVKGLLAERLSDIPQKITERLAAAKANRKVTEWTYEELETAIMADTDAEKLGYHGREGLAPALGASERGLKQIIAEFKRTEDQKRPLKLRVRTKKGHTSDWYNYELLLDVVEVHEEEYKTEADLCREFRLSRWAFTRLRQVHGIKESKTVLAGKKARYSRSAIAAAIAREKEGINV